MLNFGYVLDQWEWGNQLKIDSASALSDLYIFKIVDILAEANTRGEGWGGSKPSFQINNIHRLPRPH